MRLNKQHKTKCKWFEKSLRANLAIALASMTMLLSGCANKVTTKTEYIYPPQAFLTPCVKTPFMGSTYGEAVEHLIIVQGERDMCASQITNINKWINQTKAAK
ncbi:Rz1-like lysis system protein LysC [Haemophilus parainfluenzae]|uniref:Rz1-like lysis system protein LysC n=1 Tax=Haemophilus parainfluenzae TaxID=729 RepID=UPI003D70A144